MKLFKIIMNCVIATVLVFSLVLNILLLSGFKFVKEKPIDQPTTSTSSVQEDSKDETARTEDTSVTFQPVDSSEPTNIESADYLTYQDNNIKVTYLESKETVNGPVHKFKIENKTKKPLTILFTDVIINGQQVFISGLTCENLLPETDIVEDFVLLEKDWNHFTDSPTNVSFKIKLVNSKSRLDWYETDRINLKTQKSN